MKLQRKYFKYLLYFYTFLIIIVSTFTAFSAVESPDRTVLARCNAGQFCPACPYPQSAYCFQNGQCGCAGINQGDNGNLCTSMPTVECSNRGLSPCTPGSPNCEGNYASSCPSCSNPYNYGCYVPQQRAACENPCGASDNGKACQDGLSCVNLGGGWKCRLSEHTDWANCQPPTAVQVSCNEACNNTDRLCTTGLACISGLCRLPSNPTSATCQPSIPQVVSCNDQCNNTNLLCPSNLACVNVNGTNRCRLPANQSAANCQPAANEIPSYTIDKYIDGGQTSYNIGDLVNFKIKITNTGNVAFTNLKFRDVYNANYLTYVGGSAIKSTGGNISDINTVLTKRVTGTIEIENITSSTVLGTLNAGAHIEVSVRFIAKAPINGTCNFGYAKIPELTEINDKVCVDSKNIDTDM